MKLDTVKTLKIDDLKNAGGDIPAWVTVLLDQLNPFIESVGRVLQGNISFADNFLCRVRSNTLVHGTELEINPDAKNIKVIGVLPIYAESQTIDRYGFTRKSNGNIGVTVYYGGGSSSTSATCTLLIILG